MLSRTLPQSRQFSPQTMPLRSLPLTPNLHRPAPLLVNAPFTNKGSLYATTNRRTRTSTSSEASLAKPSPTFVELSLSRPIRPDVITSSYFSGFEEYLCKYLTMNQARTLRSIRTSRYSATVRKYGRLITPGCLQDSHLSVAQIHPLVTYPLCVYLVYIERQAPVIVVKSSSPEDLISVCKYTIADDLGSTIAGDHHFLH